MWITNSAEAEFFIVFAQSDPSKGYKGINAFAVEKSMGVEIAKKEKKLGIRASSTCTVNFDDVVVPPRTSSVKRVRATRLPLRSLTKDVSVLPLR